MLRCFYLLLISVATCIFLFLLIRPSVEKDFDEAYVADIVNIKYYSGLVGEELRKKLRLAEINYNFNQESEVTKKTILISSGISVARLALSYLYIFTGLPTINESLARTKILA